MSKNVSQICHPTKLVAGKIVDVIDIFVMQRSNNEESHMDISLHIDKFKHKGFVNMGSSLVGSEEIDKLSQLVKKQLIELHLKE